MKILMASYTFYPNVGGIESVSEMLAGEFIAQSQEVKLITATPAAHNHTKNHSFDVVRQPDIRQLFALLNWCDICFHNNISLRYAWPMLIIHKPWVVAHHTWIKRSDGSLAWQDRLKRFAIRYAQSVSISQSIADHLPVQSVIINDPYDGDKFRVRGDLPRDKDLVFVGRLVSDKGVDLLLHAVAMLKKKTVNPNVTIIGNGPEHDNSINLTKNLGLTDNVDFAGNLKDDDLTRALNAHKIAVVPSRWEEPFGIVALEAIACGCVVIGSERGGLREAIGPCGVTFPNDDVNALASAISGLLLNPEKMAFYKASAGHHLAQYCKKKIAGEYIKLFEKTLK